MRRLQLGTSQEGPSQITPTSPCQGDLLLHEEEDEEENGETHCEDGCSQNAEGHEEQDSRHNCTYCCHPASRI
ncbi:hypothetical protein JZ751_014783 [Albula glossodonta]|uniref:Uncharacterized protein n=1 Tax=Albula glossodonta TaxID=121402 RepID=A0A8T2MX29_9TELE|nr:hypothetical protein JZ751_014783 [Albula glossodonta]